MPGKVKPFFALIPILIILLVPALGGKYGENRDKLKGAYVWAEDSVFTVDRWMEGRFQSHKDQILKENFPLQPFCVKLFAQLRFMLFKQASASGVIVGTENYLFEQPYMDSYFGKNYSGRPYFRELAWKLKKVDDTLRKLNKLALFVIAPGKVNYFPEYIPQRYRSEPAVSNYNCFSTALKMYRIPHIDFNADFIARKYSSPYPLFPQFGIHWSNYGCLTAFDSICRYIEKRLHMNLPDLKFRSIEVAESREGDNDVINSMNLLWHPRTYMMAYPRYDIEYDSTLHKKPRVIAVSDSFWWYLYGNGIPQHFFSDHKFWYYNVTAYPESATTDTSPGEFNFPEEMKKTDVMLILYNESNLFNPGHGIIYQLYDLYYPSNKKNG